MKFDPRSNCTSTSARDRTAGYNLLMTSPAPAPRVFARPVPSIGDIMIIRADYDDMIMYTQIELLSPADLIEYEDETCMHDDCGAPVAVSLNFDGEDFQLTCVNHWLDEAVPPTMDHSWYLIPSTPDFIAADYCTNNRAMDA